MLMKHARQSKNELNDLHIVIEALIQFDELNLDKFIVICRIHQLFLLYGIGMCISIM